MLDWPDVGAIEAGASDEQDVPLHIDGSWSQRVSGCPR